MAQIGNITGVLSTVLTDGAAARGPVTASAQIARLEVQLSDWTHCVSGTTPTGKAKIAEITGKIDAIKDQVKKAEDANAGAASPAPAASAAPGKTPLRLDGTGTWVNQQA